VAYGNNEDAGEPRPGLLRVWNPDGSVALEREAEGAPATCVAFSSDGSRLAWGTGCWTHDVLGRVTLWGVEDDAVKAHFRAHPRGVFALAFQPGGDLLATSGREGTVCLWDARWGTARGELKAGSAPTLALAFSPDGSRLAVGSDDGSVKLWEVKTRRSLGALPGTSGKPVRGLAFSAEGRTLLAVTKKGEGKTADLLAWEGEDLRPAPATPLGETEAYCLALAPERDIFLAGCQNRTARLFQTAPRQEPDTLMTEHPIFCAAVSKGGRRLALSGGWFGPVLLWDLVE
jgi:WD40 repeat protein